MLRSRTVFAFTAMILAFTIWVNPGHACGFEEIPIAMDLTDEVTGWTDLSNGSSTSLKIEGFTTRFDVYEIGVRISAYKYDGAVLRSVNSDTSQNAGDLAYIRMCR